MYQLQVTAHDNVKYFISIIIRYTKKLAGMKHKGCCAAHISLIVKLIMKAK